MTDFHDDADLSTPKPTRKQPIQREHCLQEQVYSFAESAIALLASEYFFQSHDRREAGARYSHARESARGIRAGAPDTQLNIVGRPPIWWEAKDDGKKPDDNQKAVMAHLAGLGHQVGWGTSVVMYCDFLRHCGVPLRANADYQAMMLDAKVAANIAKAEARRDGAGKTRSPKPQPQFIMSRRGVARIRKAGIPI